MEIDRERFCSALRSNDSAEVQKIYAEASSLIRRVFTRCCEKYGKSLRPDDFGAISLDIQQEVWTQLLLDVNDESKQDYLSDVPRHIFYVTNSISRSMLDKRARNRAGALTDDEKALIRESVWDSQKRSSKRLPYRPDAFTSWEQFLESHEDVGSSNEPSIDEAGDLIEKAMAGLSEGHRELIAMYKAGYSQAEMAEQLGFSDRTVRTKLKEAKQHIAKFQVVPS